MKWQLVKQVYRASAVVGLAIVLQSNVMAQGDVGQVQVEEVVREVETVVMQPGQMEVITSRGVVIRVANGHKPSDASISIKIQEVKYDELPREVAVMLDPSFTRQDEGVWRALPLRLYKISLSIFENSATIFPVLRVYLPTKGILSSDSVYSAHFMRTEYLPPSIMMCATSEGLVPCERLSLWRLSENYVDKAKELSAGIVRYGAENYVGIFDQTPTFEQEESNSIIEIHDTCYTTGWNSNSSCNLSRYKS